MISNRGLKVMDAAESKAMVLEALGNVEEHAARDRRAECGRRALRGGCARRRSPKASSARAQAIASGAAKKKLDAFVAVTQKLGAAQTAWLITRMADERHPRADPRDQSG